MVIHGKGTSSIAGLMALAPYMEKGRQEAGCDEAGRGCIAGPVFAAAVILPSGYSNDRLNDSKKLKESARNELREVIEKDALAWCVASMDHAEIDKINILKASIQSMHKAVTGLSVKPDFLLIDGNRFTPYPDIPHACVIKGDGIYMSIAAASILAKTHRDEYMRDLHQVHPHYGWDRNKGYPTTDHREAVVAHGISPYHRRSFRILPGQLTLGL